MNAVKEKWNDMKQQFFEGFAARLRALNHWDGAIIEEEFNNQIAVAGLKKGEVMLPFRIMLVGGKYGPGVFDIAGMIGKEETLKRIELNISI